MVRLLPNDPFNPPPGDCDACGHPNHENEVCPHHPSFDQCPGYRAEPLPMDEVMYRFGVQRRKMDQSKVARSFFAKDFNKLKEEW